MTESGPGPGGEGAPRFSVVVPTHDPRHLGEAVRSALAQTVRDLEVLVVPNNGVRLDGEIPADGRVRVVPYDGPPKVGAVKRFAFGAATGRILVELDHDDLLAPRALERLSERFDRGAGFVYSNFAEFHDGTWESNTYSPYWGWKSRDGEVMGRRVREMVAFDPVPESLALVDYAPNHVRAWTREAYGKAGGHDPSRPVCDDHDLVVRTFLSGARMERVDECLYLYRVHARNTVKERNAAIRAATHSIYNERIEDIVLKWASGRRLPRYDLGGGHNPRPGWIPVDVEGATVAADLRGRWPWPDSSVGAFRAYDFLEHLPDKVHTMSEIHRCLVPGGWLLSLTPSALGNGAFMDPTHCSMWVRASFWYFTKSAFAEYIRNSCVRFREQRLLEYFPSEWHKTENIPYICADLVAVKDGYEGPGPHEWV